MKEPQVGQACFGGMPRNGFILRLVHFLLSSYRDILHSLLKFDECLEHFYSFECS